MFVRFLHKFDIETRRLLTVGEQGDDSAAGGSGGDEVGSLFDRQVDTFIDRTTDPVAPTDSTTTTQPVAPQQGLPSDPQNKQRGQPTAPVTTPQPTTPQQPAAPTATRPRPSQNGDLVDAQGNVVAAAGRERRLYETVERARGELANRDSKIRELEAAVGAYREAAQHMEKLGLTPQENMAALNLMAQFKAQPIPTLKFMLTEAQAMGHNISSLFDGAAPGLDPAAIRRIVNDAVAPLTAARESEEAAAAAHERSVQQTNEFFNSFPDATVHDQELGRLLLKHPDWSPQTAYYALQNFALQNGLDWSQPLPAQIIARQNGEGAPAPVTPSNQPPANRSVLPSSRTPVDARITDTRQQPRSNATRSRDIVAEAMAEAGITLQ